jgi:hypothetical protein
MPVSNDKPSVDGDNLADGADFVRAIAHLPGVDVEVACWRSADAEHVAISLKATPSFEAVGRAFEAANPFVFWVRSVELAWLPWLTAARAFTLPWTAPHPRPAAEADS